MALIGIDPALTGELFIVLDSMGHTDRLAIVDANYPAYSMDRKVIELPGFSVTEVTKTIAKLLPIEHALFISEGQDHKPESADELVAILKAHANFEGEPSWLDQNSFYRDVAGESIAVVKTGDTRLWACSILQRGVIA